MKVYLVSFPRRQARERYEVVLDLCDGRTLTSDAMTEEAANELRSELQRRIFEIGEGIQSGKRDRM